MSLENYPRIERSTELEVLQQQNKRLREALRDAVGYLKQADEAISGVHSEVLDKFDYSVSCCFRWCDAYPELVKPLQALLADPQPASAEQQPKGGGE